MSPVLTCSQTLPTKTRSPVEGGWLELVGRSATSFAAPLLHVGLSMRIRDVGQGSSVAQGASDIKGHQCRRTSATSAPPQVYGIRIIASLELVSVK